MSAAMCKLKIFYYKKKEWLFIAKLVTHIDTQQQKVFLHKRTICHVKVCSILLLFDVASKCRYW